MSDVRCQVVLRALFVALLLLITHHSSLITVAEAQTAARYEISGSGAPAGACVVTGSGYSQIYVDRTTGKRWACVGALGTVAGTWTESTAAAGGVTGTGVSGRVPIWNGTSTVTSDADLAFATDTLTATKIAAPTSITIGGGAAITSSGAGGALGTAAFTASTLYAQVANNLSDLVNTATARTNLALGNVDDTSDANKPVSTAQQAALDLKANLASPTFTGTVVIPTPFTLGAISVTPTGDELNFVDGVTSAIQTQIDGKQATLGFTAENSANKDATGGYAGLTLFKMNFKNAANTFTSFFTNTNTAARTYTYQDRDGTIADDTDLAGKLATNGAGTSLTGIPYTLTGTANQVVLSAGTGNITFSLPQSIATSSTPQFARVGLGGAADATALILGDGHINQSGSSTLAHGASYNAFQLGGNVTALSLKARAANNSLNIVVNGYFDGTAFKAISTDELSRFNMNDGFIFWTAPGTTAGDNATLTTRLTIGNTGTVTWSSGITDATGTPGSLCYNTSTFAMLKNNALTCTVSSRDFKQGIFNLPRVTRSVYFDGIDYKYISTGKSVFDKLRPVQFAYRDNPNRQRWGFIAEEVALANPKLADGYDAKGIPRSLDQNAILALTVKEVQELKAEIQTLKALVEKLGKGKE